MYLESPNLLGILTRAGLLSTKEKKTGKQGTETGDSNPLFSPTLHYS